MELVRLKCGFENGIDIGPVGTKGGLSLGWKGNMLVKLKSFSSYHIDVEVHDNECGNVWRFTGFYGHPDGRRRGNSWNLLRQLHQDQNQGLPLVVMGDFNEIIDSFEKKGGRLRPIGQMRDFRGVLEDCCLNDLGFVGRWFTWERGRFASTNIRERLDRGVASLSWMNTFPGYRLEHSSHSFSDHCPLLLDTLEGVWNRQNKYEKSFRFEAKWCLEGSFEGMIRRWWEEESGGVLSKLEKIGSQILKWSKVNSIKERRNRLRLEDRLMNLYTQDPSDEVLAEIMEVAVQRHFRCKIFELEDGAGRSTNSTEEFLQIASDYFGKLFSASESGSDEHLFCLVEKKVTSSMNERLLRQFTEEDIAYVVKSLAPLKAPGLDGFPALFFQRYWHIVGPEVEKPSNMTHFRPISLCNVIYKIIAKVLVLRMSETLGSCVNEAQGAFILGRLISDNVLIAYEILHSLKMKKRGKKGNFALKLDMSKVYDRVEWDFLAGVEVVRAIIHEYEMVSGKRVNFEKFLIYFGANVVFSVQEDIVNLLGVRLASNPEKYLGLPMMVGKRKKWAFANFVNQFRKRVEGWSMRYLSMGAKVGSYPSFTWRSICSARDLISDGILWCVGNGVSINIWNHPWLPGRENNRIPVIEIKPPWSTVNQLMNEEDNTWNRELIHNLVDDDTANRIFAIPISESRPEDMLVWKYEGSGEYTVRSGYRVLITDYLQSNLHMSSTNEEYKSFYMDLWALHIPEKIKIHVWRLFNNMVPHYGNLARRTLCKEAVCPLCKEDLETTAHLLGSCRVLRNIWTSLNKLVHDGRNNFATIAILARNHRGEVIEAVTYLVEGVDDAFVAKARACKRALILAKLKGFRRLIVEGDSLTVIKKLIKNEKDRSIIRSIVHNIHRLCQGFDEVSYKFVNRPLNAAAHILAVEGRHRKVCGAWVNGIPETVRLVVEEDWLRWCQRT
ncbi:uncharacterized protein [Gossypium hirsutum]|uniref:Reverse transcriptase n=1 Tax=Gossypium hirsutum TaxID=3635 RepID=A0A1U8L0N0_GOSHI|nr:uncharacterized protein LOC107921587 [Gossypium hirsutum]